MNVSPEALQLIERLRQYSADCRQVAAGDSWDSPRAHTEVLWPEKGRSRAGQDANDYSLCLRTVLEDTVFLLTGDLSGTYEPYVGVRADVLKVAHHGSRSSSLPSFLETVSPRTALISVSVNADAADSEGVVPGGSAPWALRCLRRHKAA